MTDARRWLISETDRPNNQYHVLASILDTGCCLLVTRSRVRSGAEQPVVLTALHDVSRPARRIQGPNIQHSPSSTYGATAADGASLITCSARTSPRLSPAIRMRDVYGNKDGRRRIAVNHGCPHLPPEIPRFRLAVSVCCGGFSRALLPPARRKTQGAAEDLNLNPHVIVISWRCLILIGHDACRPEVRLDMAILELACCSCARSLFVGLTGARHAIQSLNTILMRPRSFQYPTIPNMLVLQSRLVRPGRHKRRSVTFCCLLSRTCNGIVPRYGTSISRDG